LCWLCGLLVCASLLGEVVWLEVRLRLRLGLGIALFFPPPLLLLLLVLLLLFWLISYNIGMTDFEEKAGTVDYHAKDYTWTQTIEEVVVLIPVPIATRGRDLEVLIKGDRLLVKNRDRCILDGAPFGPIKPKESIWTLEDRDKETKEVRMVLQKAITHDSWKGLLQGEAIDPHTADLMDKKMMLEKFQRDYPGFDFSGANFTGQVPQDPKNWLQNLEPPSSS